MSYLLINDGKKSLNPHNKILGDTVSFIIMYLIKFKCIIST